MGECSRENGFHLLHRAGGEEVQGIFWEVNTEICRPVLSFLQGCPPDPMPPPQGDR